MAKNRLAKSVVDPTTEVKYGNDKIAPNHVSKLSDIAKEVGISPTKGPRYVELENQDRETLETILSQRAILEQRITLLQYEARARETEADRLLNQWRELIEKQNEEWKKIDRIYGLDKSDSPYRYDATHGRLVRVEE